MFVSNLWIEGVDYNARSAARRLKLSRDAYSMKGALLEFGPKKGTPRETSILRINLSSLLKHYQHIRQVEKRLGELMSFLNAERRRYQDGVSMDLSVGMTVGNARYFTRSYSISAKLMATLVALDIQLSVSAYPCSDEPIRKRL